MCEIVVDAHANIYTMYNDNGMLTCVLAVCKAKCNIARNTETQVCSWKIIGYNRNEMSDFKLDREINLFDIVFLFDNAVARINIYKFVYAFACIMKLRIF